MHWYDFAKLASRLLLLFINVVFQASHLFWGFWSLVQSVNSDIDFDFLTYGIDRFKQYWVVKDEYLSIK